MKDRIFVEETRSNFQERRAWFDAFYEQFNVGIPRAPEYGVRFTCPCCGYPTLGQRGGYEICRLCWWEDDGQDDPNADEVRGVPNHGYSLTEARQNFDRAFDSMIGTDEPTRVHLWTVIDTHMRVLYRELKRGIKAHE